jgi:hypothetical protein
MTNDQAIMTNEVAANDQPDAMREAVTAAKRSSDDKNLRRAKPQIVAGWQVVSNGLAGKTLKLRVS